MKNIFTRHGIPSDLIADNNPYNSSEYPQSNGLSEMGVKIMKRILKKCDNPELGLLEYLNMPLTGMDYSPTQLLMSRKTRTMLHVHNDLLIPSIPSNAYNQITESRDRQKFYYDWNTSELPNLLANNTAQMKKDGIWKEVRVQEKLTLPRSYNVVDKNGRLYKRNRKHLIKTNELPFVYQEQLDLLNESPINNEVPTTSNETTADNKIIKITIPEAVSPEPQAAV